MDLILLKAKRSEYAEAGDMKRARTPKLPRRSLTPHRFARCGNCRHRNGRRQADEIVRRGWKFQHRALRKIEGANLREGEIGVIETWVSTYFVIGATENLFCNARREKRRGSIAARSNLLMGFSGFGRLQKAFHPATSFNA